MEVNKKRKCTRQVNAHSLTPPSPKKIKSKANKQNKNETLDCQNTIVIKTSSSGFSCEPKEAMKSRQIRPKILNSTISSSSEINNLTQSLCLNDTSETHKFTSRNEISNIVYNPSVVKMSPSTNPGFQDGSCNKKRLSLIPCVEYKTTRNKENLDSLLGLTNYPTFSKLDVLPKQNSMSVGKEVVKVGKSNFPIKHSLPKHFVRIFTGKGMKSLLVMSPDSLLYFIGVIELEMIRGSVEVLGCQINQPNETFMLFSPQGTSHLCLRARSCKSSESKTPEELSKKLLSLGINKEVIHKVSKDCSLCICVISRNKRLKSSEVWPYFLENHLSFSVFPPNDLLNDENRQFHDTEHRTSCLFEKNLNNLGLKAYIEVAEWELVQKEITLQDRPKFILCGGKSVGKSTLLRYLINKCLQKWEQVLVLDFDLGQCEFTLPGCVSATLVKAPVLGPNYTHLQEPCRCVYLGEVDVTKCPENYIKSIKMLVNYAKTEHGTIPWLVNTMGFSRGFGVTLTCGIIKNVYPTHVIEIESKDRKLNFPSKLEPGFVNSQNVGGFGVRTEIVDYKHITIPSAAQQSGNTHQKSRGISPAEARSLVILSYVSEMLNREVMSLSQVVPYQIKLDQVKLSMSSKHALSKKQVAASMNGNLVALCSDNETKSFPNCHGFGIIRGIDWNSSTIYLITPLPFTRLKEINCLIKGNTALPESLYYNPGEKVTGQLPFLAYTSGRFTSQFAKRDFRSLPVTPKSKNVAGSSS